MPRSELVTVAIERKTKRELDHLKVHGREPNHEVVADLVDFYVEHRGPRVRPAATA